MAEMNREQRRERRKVTDAGKVPASRHVVVVTPTYDGKLEHTYVASLLQTVAACRAHGVEVSWRVRPNEPLIARARNVLVRDFLATAGTDLFFVDADVGWSPEGFLRVLLAKPDMVGGIYPKKADESQWPVHLCLGPDEKPIRDADGLFEVLYLPTGFLRVTRRALVRMIDATPDRFYQGPDGLCHALFDSELHEGDWQGEDVVFGRRWRAIGGTCWAVPGIGFTHAGGKTWRGTWTGTGTQGRAK